MISKYAVSLGKNAAWLTHFLCTKLIWTYEKLAEACKKLSKTFPLPQYIIHYNILDWFNKNCVSLLLSFTWQTPWMFFWIYQKLTEDISALMYYMTSRRTKILNKLPKQACDMYLSSRRKPLLNNKYGAYGAKEIWAYLCLYAKPTCSLKSSTWSNIELRVHWVTQLSNLQWMPNSVSIGFGTAMKTGSSRRFRRYSTTSTWVLSWLSFIVD